VYAKIWARAVERRFVTADCVKPKGLYKYVCLGRYPNVIRIHDYVPQQFVPSC